MRLKLSLMPLRSPGKKVKTVIIASQEQEERLKLSLMPLRSREEVSSPRYTQEKRGGVIASLYPGEKRRRVNNEAMTPLLACGTAITRR